MSGSSDRHEALDRVHMVSHIIAEHLTAHPFIAANPDLAESCAKIACALADLYTAIEVTGTIESRE